MKIDVCSKKEQDYIIERLVEYNLSQVEAKQKENFIDLSKKIGKDDKIVAGIVARMYCWNVVYVDTLWVDSSYRGKKLGSLLLEEVENDAKSKGAKLIHLDTFDFQAKEFYEKQGYIVFGILENFLKDKTKIMDMVEFQSRLAIATEDKLYCSKVLDYNDFVPDMTDDAGFFVKPAIIDNNQPNIMKLVAGNGLYIVCSEGIMVAAYNSVLSALSSSNIKIAGDTQPTYLTALIEDTFYYVDKNGSLRAIVPNFNTGIIRFANIIVEKYDYTRNNIKYIYKGNINEDNVLIVVPKDRDILKVYTALPDNLFRYFNIEFKKDFPVFGYSDDLISGQNYYRLTQKNMSDAKIILNMPFIQTKEQGIYLNDFKATYRRLVLNVYAPTRNDIKGITINKQPIQNLGTENYGNFNIYDFMKTISIIDTTIDIKTNQTEETIEVRGINGFIE